MPSVKQLPNILNEINKTLNQRGEFEVEWQVNETQTINKSDHLQHLTQEINIKFTRLPSNGLFPFLRQPSKSFSIKLEELPTTTPTEMERRQCMLNLMIPPAVLYNKKLTFSTEKQGSDSAVLTAVNPQDLDLISNAIVEIHKKKGEYPEGYVESIPSEDPNLSKSIGHTTLPVLRVHSKGANMRELKVALDKTLVKVNRLAKLN